MLTKKETRCNICNSDKGLYIDIDMDCEPETVFTSMLPPQPVWLTLILVWTWTLSLTVCSQLCPLHQSDWLWYWSGPGPWAWQCVHSSAPSTSLTDDGTRVASVGPPGSLHFNTRLCTTNTIFMSLKWDLLLYFITKNWIRKCINKTLWVFGCYFGINLTKIIIIKK